MKAIALLSFLSLFLHAPLAVEADDIRSKVAGANLKRPRRLEIDPDVHIYGVPFGASEDDFIKARGKPDGYVRLNDTQTVLLYGRSHAFVFESDKLTAVRITSQILDWKLANEMSGWNDSDSRNWRLNSGVFTGMNRKEVRTLLGDKLSEGEYGRCYYTTAKARVELDFSHYTSEGDGDEAYRLHGIYVRQGAETESPKRFPSFIPGPGSSRLGGGDRFGGIGVMLLKNPDTEELEIRGVVPASPAAKAGLQPGLVVLSIDGVPMEGKRLSEAVELARGAVGTMMKLEVFDPKKNESRVVELTRAEIAFPGTEGWGRQTNITLSADQVLRLEGTNGARAVIQLLGLTSGGGRSGDHEDSASYRWRFRASTSTPIQAGTNTAVDKYTLKLIGPSRFDRTSRNSGEEGRIKAGEMALDWSYGYTNKGYIRLDPSRFTPSVHGADVFDTGP